MVTISWSRIRGESSRRPDEGDEEDRKTDSAAKVELEAPVGVARKRVARDLGDDEAAEHRAERPEAHREAAADLRREVTDQRGRRDEDDALDEADARVDHHEPHLGRRVRQGERVEHAGDQQPVRDQVGPAPAVSESRQQRGERADAVGDDRDDHEVREGHVVVLDDLRRYGTLQVELVVQDDRREDRDPEVEGARPGVRVVRQLAGPEAAAKSLDLGPARRLRFLRTTRPQLSCVESGPTTAMSARCDCDLRHSIHRGRVFATHHTANRRASVGSGVSLRPSGGALSSGTRPKPGVAPGWANGALAGPVPGEGHHLLEGRPVLPVDRRLADDAEGAELDGVEDAASSASPQRLPARASRRRRSSIRRWP